MTPQILLGLPALLVPDATSLYWQAFGAKLGRVMGPEPRALRYLACVMRPDRCLCALDDRGALLGLAGFKTPQGAFAAGRFADLRTVYGPAGAFWRDRLLRLLDTDAPNDRFLIDGICVAPAARNQGIGTLLLDAICDLATQRGHSAIQLEVVDTNVRARALYERLGFRVTTTQSLGPLRHVFGFSAALTMVRDLP